MKPLNERSYMKRVGAILSMVVAIALMSACASAPVAPTSALSEARDAIAIAEQSGARQHAGAELDEAQEKLKSAEQYVENERMTAAERLAREATVSAELASARTESAKALAINREMKRSAEALDEEMRRTGEQQ